MKNSVRSEKLEVKSAAKFLAKLFYLLLFTFYLLLSTALAQTAQESINQAAEHPA